MLIIQVVGAVLLLLGSGLIFKALVEIDAPVSPKPVIRPRLDRVPRSNSEPDRLPRAA